MKPKVFASKVLRPVGRGLMIGAWRSDSEHPVDVALFRGRRDPGGRPTDHPCLYFRPRPLPRLDEAALEHAFVGGSLAGRLGAKQPRATAGGVIEQTGWVPAFIELGAPGGWTHPRRAWEDTRNAAAIVWAEDLRAYYARTELSTSFASRSERARLSRWVAGEPGPGEPGGTAFGVLARALYGAKREYNAANFPGAAASAAPKGPPNRGPVVHALACDAPWLLATDGLIGLLPSVLGVSCSRLRWPELMAILAFAPPAHWHRRPRANQTERLELAALLQLEARGHHALDVATAIAGASARLGWTDSGIHKVRTRWHEAAATRGAWSSVFPFWDEALPRPEDPDSDGPLWAWFRSNGARILTLLLRNAVHRGRLRLGAADDERPTPSLNTLAEPTLWSVVPHEEVGASWIGWRLQYVGNDTHRPPDGEWDFWR